MSRIAIVAAMEREVSLLIRNWSVRTIDHSGRRYRVFEQGDFAFVCGGIGSAAARRATEAIIQQTKPDRVLSVGFAGALDGSLGVGDVVRPSAVINSGDGVRTEISGGNGILVTSATVADQEQKERLRKAYGASAVDMEAAAVAQGARAHGLEFGVLKAISDAADFSLPALDHFIAADGTFRSARFAVYVALRPWRWGATMALARNSNKASRALSSAIKNYLAPEPAVVLRPADAPLAVDLNPIKVGSGFVGAHTDTGAEPHTQFQGKRSRK